MKDSLKEFIDANRDQFDSQVPPDGLWNKIAAGFSRTAGWWHSIQLWRAAAAVLLVLSATLITLQFQGTSKREFSRLQGEFTDLEKFYKGQIAEKVALIDHFEYGYEDDQFTQDVQKLDAMYQVLREEMKSKPSEQVRDALVLNMLIRIDLLNQQIKQLEDTRKERATVSGT
jgi:hypothetical protein